MATAGIAQTPQGPPPTYQPPTHPQQQVPPPAYQPATNRNQQMVDCPQRTQLLVLVRQPRSRSPRPTFVFEVGKTCPVCQVGIIDENCTPNGIAWAICFFPLGIICCLASMEKKCPHCGIVSKTV